MSRQRFVPWAAVSSVLWCLALSGCDFGGPPPPMMASHDIITYSQVGDPEITIDPSSGYRIRITHWRYTDGYTVDTVEGIPINGTNDFRRKPFEPPVRFADD